MPAKPLSKFTVHLSDHLDAKYKLAEKPYPAGFLTRHANHKGKSVRWLGNFGFKRKDDNADVVGALEESYDIELDPPDVAGAGLVYFDGASIKELAVRPSDTAHGKLKATLDLGDPPVGWTG